MCISKIILVVILIIFLFDMYWTYENYSILLKDNNLEKYYTPFNDEIATHSATNGCFNPPSSNNLHMCSVSLGIFVNAIKNNKMCLLPSSAKFVYWKYDKKPIGLYYLAGDTRCLLFRGTQTLEDILYDTKTTQTDGIHTGYKKIFSEINFDCVGRVDIVIGHSMGAALAQLYGYLKDPSVEVVTFASPRVYSPERLSHALAVNPKIYSVINLADAVCNYPATYVVKDRTQYVYATIPPAVVANIPRDNLQDCHSMVSYNLLLPVGERP